MYFDEHGEVRTVELLCWVPETNITLYVKYTQIKKPHTIKIILLANTGRPGKEEMKRCCSHQLVV